MQDFSFTADFDVIFIVELILAKMIQFALAVMKCNHPALKCFHLQCLRLSKKASNHWKRRQRRCKFMMEVSKLDTDSH